MLWCFVSNCFSADFHFLAALKELRTVPDGPDFTNRERLTLISHVDKLSRLIGDCERIHQTAVVSRCLTKLYHSRVNTHTS